MKILEIITESKTQKAEAPKPRNFVAKNAKMGGAGQHKDKKKAVKQGDTKHKAKQFAESHVNEISDKGLDNYRRQAHYAVQGHKFGSKKDAPNAAAIIAKREKGMQQAADKIIARKKAEHDKQMAVLIAKLPELKAEYEQMRAKYKSLGGSDWQYADRDQNMTPAEREARSMEGPMNNLWRQISAAEKAQKEKGVAESTSADLRSAVYEVILEIYKGAKDGDEMIDTVADELGDYFDAVQNSDDEVLKKAYAYVRNKGADAEDDPELMAQIAFKAIQFLNSKGSEGGTKEGQKGVAEARVNEKAVSKAQQKFMGMVYAAKKGEKPASPEVAKAAKGMTKKAAHDYAATKHKGKPDHVGESATAGATSAGNMAVGAVYPNKKGKTFKNKDGTAKNALDVKGANLMTGGSIKR